MNRPAQLGVRVHCLALGGVDLTSPAGRMTIQVINAVAEFEKDLLIERTKSGLARARAEGTKLGRPEILDEAQRAAVLANGRPSCGCATARRHSRRRCA